jgi:hypothetical protein
MNTDKQRISKALDLYLPNILVHGNAPKRLPIEWRSVD